MVAGNVLHLLEEPEKALKELTRVTRPGGVIALPTYVNGEDEDRRFLKIIGAAGFSPVHEWTARDYLAFLEGCGLDVAEHHLFNAKQREVGDEVLAHGHGSADSHGEADV